MTSKFIKTLSVLATTTALSGMTTITAFAEESAATTTGTTGSSMGMLISMVIIVIFMYFILIRPQKKKEKEAKAMQSNIEIGDELVTIGGIVGIAVRKSDDAVVIETGGEKNKMRIKLWAISSNVSAEERAAEAAKAAKKARMSPAAVNSDDEKTSKNKKSDEN